MACLAPKIKAATAVSLFMQTPKEKFSVGSLLGVFGLGKKSQESQYQDTEFADTIQPDFEDTSPGVHNNQSNETAPDSGDQVDTASGAEKN